MPPATPPPFMHLPTGAQKCGTNQGTCFAVWVPGQNLSLKGGTSWRGQGWSCLAYSYAVHLVGRHPTNRHGPNRMRLWVANSWGSWVSLSRNTDVLSWFRHWVLPSSVILSQPSELSMPQSPCLWKEGYFIGLSWGWYEVRLATSSKHWINTSGIIINSFSLFMD